jgi:hypothetical protein
MAETQAFFAFMHAELPSLIARWQEHRRETRGR